MPELAFEIAGVAVVKSAAAPTLAFDLRIASAPAEERIQSILLRCQIQLDAPRRAYREGERERLVDLFGPAELWGRSLRSLLWTNTCVVVPGFAGSAAVELPVACTFDFNVAATKYFAALEDGEAPVGFLFSGTVFYAGAGGALQAGPIPWTKEAGYRLPVRVWKEMMDLYYPDSAWICLRRDAFARLCEYRMRRGIATWEAALARLLPESEEAAVTEARRP